MKVGQFFALDDQLPMVVAIEFGHHVRKLGTIECKTVLHPRRRGSEIGVLRYRNRRRRDGDLLTGGQKDGCAAGGIGETD